METNTKNCTLKSHKDKEATIYCSKCEKYMCKKCEITHTDFFESNHNSYIYNKNNFDKIKNDKQIIEYDVKAIKEFINNIKETNAALKSEFEKIEQKKEEIKIKLQKSFTKLRDEINKLEDDIFLKIDGKFEKLEINEKIKKNDIIINKIKSSLNDNSFQFKPFINELKDINIKDENINNLLDGIMIPNENQLDEIIEKMKNCFLEKKSIINSPIMINSSIIKNDLKKFNLLNEWIKEKMDKDQIKYELIFKMSQNGTRAEDFHKFCNDKGATLTIIKTTGNQIFGGFTPLDWKSLSNNYELIDKTRRTFLFSLNLMKKFEMLSNQKTAIYSSKNFGPSFGQKDIGFEVDLKSGRLQCNQYSNFCKEKIELIESERKYEEFDTTEIEVFKVI